METLLKLLRQFEGLHKKGKDGRIRPYLDCVGIPTVGYGTIIFDKNRESFSVEECEAMMVVEAERKMNQVLRLCPILASEPEYRLAAVVSWVYNLGIGAFSASTFRKRLKEKRWEEAAIEMMKWKYAGGKVVNGLVIRRGIEASVLLGHM